MKTALGRMLPVPGWFYRKSKLAPENIQDILFINMRYLICTPCFIYNVQKKRYKMLSRSMICRILQLFCNLVALGKKYQPTYIFGI